MLKDCGICTWIHELSSSPYLIKELDTGYAVLSKYQYNRGYCLFLYKEHVTELHDLPREKRQKFLEEMSELGEAIYKALSPAKMNYELLGNTEPHMHWHIFPRYIGESEFERPIWVVDKSIRQAKSTEPSDEEIEYLTEEIRNYLP